MSHSADNEARLGMCMNDLDVALQGYADAVGWAQRFKGEVERLILAMGRGATSEARAQAMDTLVKYGRWLREQADGPMGGLAEIAERRMRNVVG